MIKTEDIVEEEILKVSLPDKLVPVFEGEARYRGSFGGRGSGKTRTFALMTAVKGYLWGQELRSGQILCGREFMNSLEDSSLEEIKQAIRSVPVLEDYYELGEKYVRSKDGLISYTFVGLRRSLDSIKSKAHILLAWVDEAESVSESAWRKLIPTVREEGSEIWVTWNPESKYSATHDRFRVNKPKNSKIVELNFTDNKWFPDVLEQERLEDKDKRIDMYEHIWEGGFLVFSEGAYYSTEMRRAKDEDRVGGVRYDRAKSVVTAWDLGIGDSTAIWFAQFIGTEIHIIDYYEASGVGLDHYAIVLQEKGYVYEQHILPHDVRVRELGTGKSRLETLDGLGIRNVEIAPDLRVDDGIQAARSMINKCWFDAKKCEKGIDCLINYTRDWDENGKTWRSRPRHDWASHGADAFRYLAIGYKPMSSSWDKPIKRNIKGVV
jgi:phage terminase large subunit